MASGYFRQKLTECFDCGCGPLRGQNIELRPFQIGTGKYGAIILCQSCAIRRGLAWIK